MSRKPASTTVISTACALTFAAGCHPAITETIHLPAGLPVEIPSAALSFALSFPGVEGPASIAAPPEPTNTEE